jgi:lipopolysaccharide transport system ATP-binding protein
MGDSVIKVENIGKLYKLGEIGTGTISHDLNRWWARVRGKEDPFAKIGEINDRATKGNNDWVWALKDINFEVKQGEILGIIGRNGAGKSTLLKILSKVTTPSTGRIKVKGRIASLLEVGTGFHPELTGRENIFLNGAILGMTKVEIKSKFDEIVDFSGVERYIDTPVKRYSSGMYVRLAFAVAAHLEPEILIVDEVLAVGDAEFQKKCLGKMNDISQKGGRTVLFVSHNLSAVRQLCSKGILLNKGKLFFSGTSQETIDKYLETNQASGFSDSFIRAKEENKDIQLVTARLFDSNNLPKQEFDISEDIYIDLTINCSKVIPNLYGYIIVKNSQEEVYIESDTLDYLPNCLDNLTIGDNIFKIKIRSNVLAHGTYTVYISFASSFADSFNVDIPGDILKFTIVDTETQRGHGRVSKTSNLLKWEIQNA